MVARNLKLDDNRWKRAFSLTNHYNFRRRNSSRNLSSRNSFPQVVSRFLLTLLFAVVATVAASATAQSPAGSPQKKTPPTVSAPDSPPLVIDTTSLPGTYPKADYSVQLHAHGGAPPYQWKVESGDLPPGLILDDDGALHGTPRRAGEFHFTISARDGSRPQQAIQREYSLNVLAAISMQWKNQPTVSGSRIDGSVVVTNTTEDDLDFTFVVLAVADNGRATAIGYQRFPLKKGTIDFEIPFGENLAHGNYVVHVDGVGEIADKNEIHRARLQTPVALQVVAGP